MDLFKKPIVTYIGMVVAALAIVSASIGIPEWLPSDIAWSIGSIAGFGSIASLRAYLEVNGWKTYASVAIGMAINIPLALGWIDAEIAKLLTAGFAPVIAMTLQSTAKKIKAG